MAISSNTAGQPKCGLRNAFDGLRIVLPDPVASGQQVYPKLHAFDTLKNAPPTSAIGGLSIVLSAPAASVQQVYPTRRAFDGLMIAPPAPASTSAESTSGMKHLPYDVFINHHGGDVKYTLASSIYNMLTATGLRVFLDKDELKLGDFFPRALEEAIRSASFHIAIFSENYAKSPWCLAELACMLQTGIKFIPIFYHVQPSTLRWTFERKGIYADALSNHETKSRYTSEQLQSWRLALHNATFHTGETINNQGDETNVVTNVVNHVLQELKKDRLDVAKHPVGLDEAEQDFNDKIALQSTGPIQIVGIYGMGGMGKTTLAKRLYNKKCSIIGKSSFLSDVREAAKNKQLHKKQKRLLEDLRIKGKVFDFDNEDEGKEILKSSLKSVSVLIVLDDVDHTDQLDALLPARDSLGQGSFIIVTTRELRVLRAGGISTTYKMTTLNDAHAEQLFCWHAFGQPSPFLGFEDLARSSINACDGLPLSLKVVGGLLCGESSKKYWQSQLDKLSRIVPDDIKLRLKISYDALDKEEKEMFLDIACFFIGWTSDTAIAVWDGSEWNGLHGWQRLVNKCLVELDEYNFIRMHDHLRDLGREIANQQSPYRLWSKEQIIEIQPQQDAVRIRGIAHPFGDNCYHCQGEIIIKTNQGQRNLQPSSLGLKIFVGNGDFINEEYRELSTELVCLRCSGFEHKNLPSWLSLKKLRILELSDPERLERLWERDADAPLQLRELVIQNSSSFGGFPRSIALLKNLKKISISKHWRSDDTLSSLPQEFCNLHSLEHLEIIFWSNLSYLPSNIGKLTNLQHLDLTGCSTLKMLPDSCKKLKLLKYLNLSYCNELTIKSELHILENMTKLSYLSLKGCRKLEELRLPEVASLTELYLEGTRLKYLPANIFQLTKLTKLVIGSEFLVTLPTCLENLSSLTTLNIEGCKKLESLPDSLEHLNFLRYLIITETGVKCLPKSFIHLESLQIYQTPISELSYGPGCMLKTIILEATKVSKISICGDCCPFLETLTLSLNEDLREIEILPATLKSLYVFKCKVLKDIRGVRGLKNLKNLSIEDCEEVDGLSCFSESASLETFKLKGSSKVKKIAGLQELRSLRELSIELDELPSLAELTSLIKITLQKCKKWEKIETLDHLRSLKELKISDCPELEALPSLQLTSLEKLMIDNCPGLYGLSSFGELTSLKEFELIKCHKLEKIGGLENLQSLKKLKVSDCPELDGLPSLAKLISLENLILEKCNKLEKIEGLGCLPLLNNLKIIDFSELDGLPSLAELTSLKEFELIGCQKLEKIDGLESLRSLKTLTICSCPELNTFPILAELTFLREFELKNCYKLKKIESLKSLRSVETLRIFGCSELDGLPGLAELTSLKHFELSMWHKLNIEGLQCLRSLQTLKIYICLKLDTLPSLAELTFLKEIKLEYCYKLKKIEGLESLRLLKKLMIHYIPELSVLPNLAGLISLKELILKKCNKLENIESLKCLTSLEMLGVYNCPELDGLPSLAELTSLKKFKLIGCHKLGKIEGLESLRSLETFRIDDCPELHTLPSLAELISLKKFKLKNCNKLKKIQGLERLTSLEKLRVHTPSKGPCIVSLEHCERLESLVVVANDRAVVEPFISNIQKWPSEVIICTRAMIDVGSLKNFFTSFPLKNVVEFGSFGRLTWKRPESSANANAILISCIIDYVYPELRFRIRTDRGNGFDAEFANGKWLWMGIFPQGSDWLQSNQYTIRASIKGKNVKVKEAWLVMGEDVKVKEAFHQLSQRTRLLDEQKKLY